MEYTRLGRTGLNISRLVLGTFNFGAFTDEQASHTLMSEAIEHGINIFDTADVYNFNLGENSTENIIGRWFAEDTSRRDKVILATKIYLPLKKGQNQSGLSAYRIRKVVEECLTRLQTDHIDILQFHHVDRNTSWEEYWQAIEQLMRDGKITYVGSSNIAAWEIVQANAVADKRHLLGLVSDQSIYNLLQRTIELEVLPACKNLQMATLPYSPLAGGKLAGVLQKFTEGRRSTDWVQGDLAQYRPQIEQFEALCKDLGEHPAQVALAWVLHQDLITAPIIGARTTEQLMKNIEALDLSLDTKTLEKLDAIFPKVGCAPAAYAW